MIAIAAMLTASCERVPTIPSTLGPTIACPAAQTVPSPAGGATNVDYPKPAFSGGVAPVTVSCSPPAGSSFPVGTTSVTCHAVDANQKSATCSFNVSVTRPPQLSATRFLAFGDSITEGKNGDTCSSLPGASNCSLMTTMNPADRLRALEKMIVELEASPAAYPRVLQGMLASRYVAQTVETVNEGFGGEVVADGKNRLNDVLRSSSAQVLLLQEGANDMNQSTPISAYIDDLRSMVRAGRRRGMRVFLGTLLPQREHGCRAFDYCDGKNDTIVANISIRSMATAEGATLVDLYPVFDGQTATLLGLDGLHPTVPGYAKIAETFLNAIKLQLEVP